MGEEETKTEESKNEEETKAEEKPPEETKDEAAAPPPSQPPAEILLKVFMHCEGCARKVRRCLKDFPGVEGVTTDCKTHEVIVKGEKADPVKVVERIQTKSRRKVELVSPIPNPPEEEKAVEEEEKPAPEEEKKEEEKKEEPQIVTSVLKVHMHCEACAEEIKKRILKMKGVESVEADLKKSEVTVNGVYDPTMLVKYVSKRFGKRAVTVNEEKVEEEAKAEEEEKSEQVEEKKEEGESEAKPQENPEEGAIVVQETKVEEETKKNEYYYNPPMDMYAYPQIAYHAYPPVAYPACPAYYQTYPPAPQIFSDENPNACSVM